MLIKSPRSEARRVLDTYGAKDIPIDVESLCGRLGIALYCINLSELEVIAKRPISGLIHKDADNKCTIFVNENDIAVRRRFTIAHEIGHYFLHIEHESTRTITSFRSDRSPRETEANVFASELLMPEDMVIREHENMVIPVAESLAQKFNVSKPAMRIRLEELELLYV